MPERAPFAHKLLKSLDRIDRESVQTYVLDLVRENSVYQEILGRLGEGIIVTSAEGRIRYINSQAEIWLGLKVSGVKKYDLWKNLSDALLAQFIKDNLPDLKAVVVENFHVLSPREIHLRVALIPLECSTEKEILILLMNAGEEHSRTFDDERLARIEALVSLAAGVAHEIGNPLNSLSIHLELLKKEVKKLPSQKQKLFDKTLAVLNAETTRLDKIVRNFLKATRKPPVRFQSENLNSILEEALRFLNPELKENHVIVHFRPDRDLPLFLMDRERLHQVFINLIKNAMEAMPKGGPLRITVSHRENIAVLRFQDEGSGIPEKDLPHIFEAYYTTKEEGSGLGLMTVYNAIREHGGRIEVASKAGKGTTFTLLIPMRRAKLQLSQETP